MNCESESKSEKDVYEDSFGYIPKPIEINIPGVSIQPLENCSEVNEYVRKSSHKDGYLYPGTIATYRRANEEDDFSEEIPNTRRPCPILHVPASHELRVDKSLPRPSRQGIGGFLIQLVGFLYGVRVQFHDWRLDGRVTVKDRSGFVVHRGAAERFCNAAIEKWISLPKKEQDHLTAILAIHAKAKSEEYEWLAFTLYYFVFDACYRILRNEGQVQNCTHPERLDVVADYFGLMKDAECFCKWVKLRNDLFHESLWCGELPGSSVHHRESNLEIFYIHDFTSKVITGTLGYNNTYLSEIWKTIGEVGFD